MMLDATGALTPNVAARRDARASAVLVSSVRPAMTLCVWDFRTAGRATVPIIVGQQICTALLSSAPTPVPCAADAVVPSGPHGWETAGRTTRPLPRRGCNRNVCDRSPHRYLASRQPSPRTFNTSRGWAGSSPSRLRRRPMCTSMTLGLPAHKGPHTASNSSRRVVSLPAR
jgi:hypothetical protein